jgi:hypothetical protein
MAKAPMRTGKSDAIVEIDRQRVRAGPGGHRDGVRHRDQADVDGAGSLEVNAMSAKSTKPNPDRKAVDRGGVVMSRQS